MLKESGGLILMTFWNIPSTLRSTPRRRILHRHKQTAVSCQPQQQQAAVNSSSSQQSAVNSSSSSSQHCPSPELDLLGQMGRGAPGPWTPHDLDADHQAPAPDIPQDLRVLALKGLELQQHVFADHLLAGGRRRCCASATRCGPAPQASPDAIAGGLVDPYLCVLLQLVRLQCPQGADGGS